MRTPALIYLAAIILAEVNTVFIAPLVGVAIHASLVLILLILYARSDQTSRFKPWPALALLPLLRILSLSMPARSVPTVYWPIVIGVPLAAGIWLVIRLLRLTREQLGLQVKALPLQVAVGLTGIPLGLAAYLVLKPPTTTGGIPLSGLLAGLAINFVFSGLVEEMLFRGALQASAEDVFGGWAVIYSTALYMTMVLGTYSAGYILVVGLSGLVAGWCTQQTSSLLGAILLRLFFLAGLTVLWPVIYHT